MWKDKIPEIGHFTGFRKNKLAEPQSIEYVDRFLLESCYGELGHFFSLFFGFTVLFLYPLSDVWFALAIPVAIVNFFLNLPSLLVLRYNSYKLVILKKSLLKKQQRAKAAETSANGMEKVHRDTFHAGLGLGRFILALVWYGYITGNDVRNVKFDRFDTEVTEEEYRIALEAAASVLER